MTLGRGLAGLAGAAGGNVIGDAVMRVGVDTSGVRRGMAAATAEVQRGTMGWGTAFKAVGLATVGIAAGVAGFAGAGVKASMDLNAALGQVYAMTGQSKEAMAGFREEILNLSGAVGKGPAELAEALYFVTSAGITGADALKVVEASAKAAAAGMTDVASVTDGVTSVLNAYGMEASNAEHVTDVLSQAIISGKFEWDELAGAVGKVSVYASQAGIPLEELAAAMATISQIGLSARDSSFQLISAIRGLNTPSDQQRKIFKQLGIEWDENTLRTKGLVGALQYLEDQMGKQTVITERNKDGTVNWTKTMESTEKVLGNSNVTWRKLLGNQGAFLAGQLLLGDNSRVFNSVMEDMADVAGRTNETFEKTREMNMGLVWEQMQAKIQVAAIRLGDELLPIMQRFMGWMDQDLPRIFEKVGGFWNDHLRAPVSKLLEAIGNLAGAIGRVFTEWSIFGEGGGPGITVAGIFERIAGAMGVIIDVAASIIDVMGKIADNEVVRRLGQLAIAFVTIRTALSGINAMRGLFNRLAGGTFNFLTGQRGQPNANDPMAAAAQEHKTAASGLQQAARDLSGAARRQRAGGAGVGLPPATNPRDFLRRQYEGFQYDSATPLPPALGGPRYGNRYFDPATSQRGMPNGRQVASEELQALSRGRAVPIAGRSMFQQMGMDAQMEMLRYMGLDDVQETQRQARTFRDRITQGARNLATGVINAGRVVRDAARTGGGGLLNAGRAVRGIEDAAKSGVRNYFDRMNRAVQASLAAGPARDVHGQFARGGMLRRWDTAIQQSISQMFAGARSGFNDAMGKALAPIVRGALNTAFAPIDMARSGWRGLQRFNDSLIQSVARGLEGLTNLGSRISGGGNLLSRIRNAGVGFVDAATMQFGNGMDSAMRGLSRARAFVTGADFGAVSRQFLDRTFANLNNALANGMRSAATGLVRGYGGYRQMMIAGQDAAGSMIRSGMTAVGNGLIAGASAVGRGAIAAPGAIVRGARAAGGTILRGLTNSLVGSPAFAEVMTADGPVRVAVGRQGGLIRSVAGVFSRVFWPAMTALFVAELMAEPAAGMLEGMGRDDLAQGIRDRGLIGAMSRLFMVKINGVLDQTMADFLTTVPDTINIGNLRMGTMELATDFGLSPRTIEALVADPIRAFNESVRDALTAGIKGSMAAPTWDAEIDEGGLDALVDNTQGQIRRWARQVVDTAKQIGVELPGLEDALNTWQPITAEMVQGYADQVGDRAAEILRREYRGVVIGAIESAGFKIQNAEYLSDDEIERFAGIISEGIEAEYATIVQAMLDAATASANQSVVAGAEPGTPIPTGFVPTVPKPTGGQLTPEQEAWFTEQETMVLAWLNQLQQLDIADPEGKMRNFAADFFAVWTDDFERASDEALSEEEAARIRENLLARLQYVFPNVEEFETWEGAQAFYERLTAFDEEALREDFQERFKNFLKTAPAGIDTSEIEEMMSQPLTETLSQMIGLVFGDEGLHGRTQDGTKSLFMSALDALPEGEWKTKLKEFFGVTAETGMDWSKPELRRVGNEAVGTIGEEIEPEKSGWATLWESLFADTSSTGTERAKNMLRGRGRSAIGAVEEGVKEDGPRVGTAINESLKPGAIPQGTQDGLFRTGIKLIDQIIAGIWAAPDPGEAIAQRVSRSGAIPQSPVKTGPMKHPFLPRVGQRIVEQINEGIDNSSLHMPSLAFDARAVANRRAGNGDGTGAGTGTTENKQELYVDKMYVQSDNDKESILEQLAFMAPSGR